MLPCPGTISWIFVEKFRKKGGMGVTEKREASGLMVMVSGRMKGAVTVVD